MLSFTLSPSTASMTNCRSHVHAQRHPHRSSGNHDASPQRPCFVALYASPRRSCTDVVEHAATTSTSHPLATTSKARAHRRSPPEPELVSSPLRYVDVAARHSTASNHHCGTSPLHHHPFAFDIDGEPMHRPLLTITMCTMAAMPMPSVMSCSAPSCTGAGSPPL